eukprot:Nitzschia sp. Nitz4//scaffold37_size175936//63571//66282//NITZ4_002041-RA/size175936-processed-gene-0.43-mRNA-1//1//CDS//3329549773//3253//frame0
MRLRRGMGTEQSPIATYMKVSLLYILVLLQTTPAAGFDRIETASPTASSTRVPVDPRIAACWTGRGVISIPESGGLSLPDNYQSSRLANSGCITDYHNLMLSANPPEVFGPKTVPGIEVQGNQELQVTLRGDCRIDTSALNNTEVFVVFQLCAMGIGTTCTPIIPSLDAVDSETDNMLTSTVEGFVAYKRPTIQYDGSYFFQETLAVSGATIGTYVPVATIMTIREGLMLSGSSIGLIYSNGTETVAFTEEPQQPARVLPWAAYIVYSLSGVGGTIILFLLVQMIVQRNAQVFQLSQGKFLAVMLFFALVAVSSLCLYRPRNDLYCKLWQPMITMPSHFMYAILLARMWRIRAIISPLLLLTMEKKEHWTQRCIDLIAWLTKCGSSKSKENEQGHSQKQIRKSITDRQLARVIVLLCLPQIVVQILMFVLQDQKVVVDFDATGYEIEGHQACKYRYFNNVLGMLSFIMVILLFVGLLILAQASKDLPSLFNETQSLLDVAWVAVSFLSAGAIVIFATSTSDASATVEYLVWTGLSGVTAIYTCVKITWPKLVVAWSGNKVLVSKLIADHNRNRSANYPSVSERFEVHEHPNGTTVPPIPECEREESPPTNSTDNGTAQSAVHGTDPFGANDDSSDDEHDEQKQEDDAKSSASSVVMIDVEDELGEYEDQFEEAPPPPAFNQASATTNASGMVLATTPKRPLPKRVLSRKFMLQSTRSLLFSRNDSARFGKLMDHEAAAPPPLRGNVKSMGALDERHRIMHVPHRKLGNRNSSGLDLIQEFHGHHPTIEYNPRRPTGPIEVSENEPPPRRLLLRMIDVQRMLAKMNQAILTGLSAERGDWEEIRRGCVALGESFTNEVQFLWEGDPLIPENEPVGDLPGGPPPLAPHAPVSTPGTIRRKFHEHR